jgi:hypothetical protein
LLTRRLPQIGNVEISQQNAAKPFFEKEMVSGFAPVD